MKVQSSQANLKVIWKVYKKQKWNKLKCLGGNQQLVSMHMYINVIEKTVLNFVIVLSRIGK